jgi:hypothetical protein
MGISKGPTEGGSGGKRGHSGMEHWGFTDEVKETAKRRRRMEDKEAVEEDLERGEEPHKGNRDDAHQQ